MRLPPSAHSSARALLLGSALLLAACSGASSGRGSSNPSLITREQFEELTGENAAEIVQRLRPSWLRPRDQGTLTNPEPAYPAVFLDGTYFGGLDALSRFQAAQIEQFRYLNARDATTRYGGGFPGGIIEITTRSRTSQGDTSPR